MTTLPTFARLNELRRALETILRVTTELDVNQTLVRLAAQDPERWNYLLDSLSVAMEPGEIGTVQQVLTALIGAIED
jgi:hypothetical protein